MARGYQRLEELDEKAQPAARNSPTDKAAKTGKAGSFGSLAIIVLLIAALGGALFYAARMKESADAMKALADKTKKETIVIHQQVQLLEGERDSLKTRVDTLSAQLKKAEDEKGQLQRELETLKKARAVPPKQDIKKTRKRA